MLQGLLVLCTILSCNVTNVVIMESKHYSKKKKKKKGERGGDDCLGGRDSLEGNEIESLKRVDKAKIVGGGGGD